MKCCVYKCISTNLLQLGIYELVRLKRFRLIGQKDAEQIDSKSRNIESLDKIPKVLLVNLLLHSHSERQSGASKFTIQNGSSECNQ